MKKTAIASALALCMGSGAAYSATMSTATFTMFNPTGGTVGVDTAVTGAIGGGTWTVASTVPFFGVPWNAHDGVTFGPGTYSVATGAGSYTGVVVGAGQIGGLILFDWGASSDIDVINVWDVNCAGATCTYTSTDAIVGGPAAAAGPDGILGVGMIDGPFLGFHANFDFTTPNAVPVPAAVWLFASGLIGLVGVARRKKAA